MLGFVVGLFLNYRVFKTVRHELESSQTPLQLTSSFSTDHSSGLATSITLFSLGFSASPGNFIFVHLNTPFAAFRGGSSLPSNINYERLLYLQLISFRGSSISSFHFRVSSIHSTHIPFLLYRGSEVQNPNGFRLCSASSDSNSSLVLCSATSVLPCLLTITLFWFNGC